MLYQILLHYLHLMFPLNFSGGLLLSRLTIHYGLLPFILTSSVMYGIGIGAAYSVLYGAAASVCSFYLILGLFFNHSVLFFIQILYSTFIVVSKSPNSCHWHYCIRIGCWYSVLRPNSNYGYQS